MKLLYFLILFILTSCSPIPNEQSETKYPEVPTMQSAEDATTGQLFK